MDFRVDDFVRVIPLTRSSVNYDSLRPLIPSKMQGLGMFGKKNHSPESSDVERDEKFGQNVDSSDLSFVRLRIFAMLMIVSLGGFIFGYDIGQISGFVQMQDFIDRFADKMDAGELSFSNTREGTIVGLVSVEKGTLEFPGR